MLRESVVVLLDPSVRGFDVRGLKGRFTDDQRVDDYSKRPDIDLVGVTVAALENFWGDVVRSPANGSLFLAIEIEFSREPKVTQFNLHLVVPEPVAQLEVSVDDAVGMEVLESVDDLDRVTLNLQFVQPLPPLQQLIHALVLAQLQKNVDIFGIFEEVLELTNMVVLDAPVDFDFAHKLLLCATLCEA